MVKVRAREPNFSNSSKEMSSYPTIPGLDLPEVVVEHPIFSDEQMIETAFNWHRERGFPYRDMSPAVCMKEINELAETHERALIHTSLAYQIADSFHHHRMHASTAGMSAPFDSFNDDVKLKKAIRLTLKYTSIPHVQATGVLTLVSGTQACSNFRPGFACYLYKKYCPDNAVVLDSSTGYGGRLVGAIASRKVAYYIGIDPNIDTHNANLRMIETLGSPIKVELHNVPAEDFPAGSIANWCDFSFTSPPYFSKEHYSEADTQSWVRYKTGDAWRELFLRKMIELQFIALKPGSYNVVNIAPVKINSKVYPLDQWTVDLALETGFECVESKQFPLSTRFGANQAQEKQFEPVLIFRKPLSSGNAPAVVESATHLQAETVLSID